MAEAAQDTTTSTGDRPVDQQGDDSGLKRSMGKGLLTIYGAGTILGAGIYVLIGELAGVAGWWLPLAFLTAAVAAGINGMAYAELSTRKPQAGGPSAYVRDAFSRQWFASIIGWMIVVTGVVSAATIATGFAGYLGTFLDAPPNVVVTVLLVGLGGVAALGAKQSGWFMAATTALGVIGLAIVIGVGFFSGSADPGRVLAEAPSLTDAATLTAVLSATFLAVYAFIGFEDMVHMAEEVKSPGTSMPFAIISALGIAAVLYVVVAFASLAVVSPDDLASAEAPLVAVVEAGGFPTWPVAALSLWIIMNGALAQLIMASRVMLSLGRNDGGAPDALGHVSERTDTPLRATVVAVAVALTFALLFPLQQLASITSFTMLLVFMASNAALIVLERREPEAPFDTPRWLPWVGLVVSAGLAIASFVVSGSGH